MLMLLLGFSVMIFLAGLPDRYKSRLWASLSALIYLAVAVAVLWAADGTIGLL